MFVSSGSEASGLADGADVTYGFTNRTPQMKLSRGAYKWLLAQMDSTYRKNSNGEKKDTKMKNWQTSA